MSQQKLFIRETRPWTHPKPPESPQKPRGKPMKTSQNLPKQTPCPSTGISTLGSGGNEERQALKSNKHNCKIMLALP